MRIVAGQFRGLTLAAVGKGDAAAHLRPTSDRVRESLFSTLEAGFDDPVTGARVLDLFAGTGALGLEAISRGASHTTFVDDGVAARALLRENIDKTRTQGITKVYRRNATRLGANHGAPFSLLFLDPPYGKGLGAPALTSALEGAWCADGALIVWEEAAPQPPPPGFRQAAPPRHYGDTVLTFLAVGSMG